MVHAARRFVGNGEILLKLDFKNAFNSMKRETFLKCIQEDLPELYNYVYMSYGNPSLLFVPNYENDALLTISSTVGVQQGDPLGPFLFSVGLQPMVDRLVCPFNAWYLDDGALGGSLECVVSDLHEVVSLSEERGLVLNPGKTEVFINPNVSRERCNDIKQMICNIIGDPIFVSQDALTLLGAPLLPDSFVPALTKKLSDLKRLAKNLKPMDAHDALFLLRHCYAIPKLTHLLRSSACFDLAVLCEFDDTLRSTLEGILNTSLHDRAWDQASLPSSLGGLGIRKASEVALPAFLASIYSSKSLVESLLPEECLQEGDPLHQVALSRWSGDGLPEISSRGRQKAWDYLQCEAKANLLLETAGDQFERARLLAARSPHANDWIEAVPSSQLGLKLNDHQLRITVSLQLGSAIFHPHTCVCGAGTDRLGYHGLVCKRNSGRFSRHNEINDLLKRALQSARIPSILEPAGLNRDDGKKPDGVTLCSWAEGKPAVWDFTCRDTLAPSHVSKTAINAGAAASVAEMEKRGKYSGLSQSYTMIPVGVETLGGWGPSGLSFIKDIGRRLTQTTGEPRSSAFLFQRLSAAVKRGNASAILSCVPQGKDLEELYLL